MDLPLHPGKAPHWLTSRMRRLAKEIFSILIFEYGTTKTLKRLSNPLWFQSLSCALAYDWHSSGTTTVVCAVLKSVLSPEVHGIGVVGGKGKYSRKALEELEHLADEMGLDSTRLKYISKMTAKVDNTCLQDSYNLYHHSMFVSEKKAWSVIQQGMNPQTRYARRYQWFETRDFVEEPHQGIVGKREKVVMDLTSKSSRECRKTSLDLVRENPRKLKTLFKSMRREDQKSLKEWMPDLSPKDYIFKMPERVNWKAVKNAYELQPENFEGFLEVQGVGPATIRGLALVSELIFGDAPSYSDPVKFSFAYGGKDGVPFEVDRRAMDESTEILKDAIQNASLEKQEKLDAIRRLKIFTDKLL